MKKIHAFLRKLLGTDTAKRASLDDLPDQTLPASQGPYVDHAGSPKAAFTGSEHYGQLHR